MEWDKICFLMSVNFNLNYCKLTPSPPQKKKKRKKRGKKKEKKKKWVKRIETLKTFRLYSQNLATAITSHLLAEAFTWIFIQKT